MFTAPVARLVRAVLAAALSGAMTVIISNIGGIRDIVIDTFGKFGIHDDNIVVAAGIVALAAMIQAADKWFRDNGWYPNVLEK